MSGQVNFWVNHESANLGRGMKRGGSLNNVSILISLRRFFPALLRSNRSFGHARLWQVFFYEWSYYSLHPAEIRKVLFSLFISLYTWPDVSLWNSYVEMVVVICLIGLRPNGVAWHDLGFHTEYDCLHVDRHSGGEEKDRG